MRKILIALMICILTSSLSNAAAAIEAKIAAVVNGNIITVNDVENRVKLYLHGRDMSQVSQQEVMALTYQTLGELIDESLQIQEANKFNIQVGENQIDDGIDMIAKRNNGTAEDMKKSLKEDGIDISTLKDKIAAEISWNKLISRKLYSKVSVSNEEIDMMLENMQNQSGKNFLVAEILLLVPDVSQEKTVLGQANQLIEKIKQGVPFDAVAKQFSQAPGANKGGDLGWVKDGQLASSLNIALENMQKGQLSDPIRSPKGWHILLLRDIKEIKPDEAEGLKDNSEARNNIAAQIGNQQLNQLAKHYLDDLRATALIEKRL